MATTSPSGEVDNSPLVRGLWRHGRFFGDEDPPKYLFPIDLEELQRLDLFHKFFLILRDDKLHTTMLTDERPLKIMDLGTGTGIWAIHMAERLDELKLEGEILAVDINQIQPQMIPRSVRTQQQDLEEAAWPSLLHDCDLVHVRLMLGCIGTDLWDIFYYNVLRHLAPGRGTMEQVEIDWTVRWAEGERPSVSALQDWSDKFLEGMERFGRSARLDSAKRKQQIESAGFCDIKEEVIQCFLSPWQTDKQARESARWFNLGIMTGLEAMSLMPLIDKLGLTLAEANEVCEKARKEACVLKFHSYLNVHVWTARRPPRDATRE